MQEYVRSGRYKLIAVLYLCPLTPEQLSKFKAQTIRELVAFTELLQDRHHDQATGPLWAKLFL
jgi:hypothetical protein